MDPAAPLRYIHSPPITQNSHSRLTAIMATYHWIVTSWYKHLKETVMKTRTMLAAVAAFGLVFSARADFNISLDLSDKPMKDLSTSTCGPTIGYAGCLSGEGGSMAEYWFVTNRVETAAALKSAGAWFQRMWSANAWFARRKPNPYNPESKDKKERDNHRKYRQVNPDSAFKFWKDNGFKVLFTLEAWSGDKAFKEIIEFVDYIVANEYQCVVAGFDPPAYYPVGDGLYPQAPDEEVSSRQWQ